MSMIIEKIEKELDIIRPFLKGHGGGVIVDKFDKKSGIVHVKFQGACAACPLSALTYQNLIADRLSVIPQIKEVILIH